MKTTTALGLLFVLLAPSAIAQPVLNDPLQNRALHKLLTGAEIQTIQDTNPEFLDRIHQYLTASFDCEYIDCSECPVDPERFYNHDLFNVFEYEYLRSADAVTFEYRGKYLITLHPLAQLYELTQGITPYELIHGVALRPLPEWVSTGNDAADLVTYKAELLAWRNDFPKEFAALLHAPTLSRIRFTQFQHMSPEQRASLSTLENGYLIIDDEIAHYFQQ